MAKYFNVQKAIQAGYSPAEVEDFMKKNNLSAPPISQPQPQAELPAPTNPVSQPSFNEKLGQGILDIGKSIASPFIRTGKNIIGAVSQAPLSARASYLANIVNDDSKSDEEKDRALKELRRVNQLNKLLAPFAETGKAQQSYKKDFGSVVSSPEVSQQARDAVNIASYGVPFGKGTNILTKAVLPGSVVGAMQEASKEGATLPSVVGSGAIGGLTSGAIYGATKIPSLLKSFGKGAEKTGTKIIQSQYNLPRSSAVNLRLPETVKTLSEYGLNSTDDVLNKSDDIISLLEKPVQKSVSGAKPVKLDGFTEVVKNIVEDPSIKTGQDEKILKFIDKLIQKVTKGGKGSQITFEGDPNGVLETIRTLQKKASDVARGKLPSAISDEERALKQAYNLIADELEDRLFQTAGADKLVSGSVSDVVDALKKFSPKLAEEASKAKTVGELRSLMAPFVRGKQAVQITELGQNLATETMGGAVRGVAKAIPSISDPLAPLRFIADQPAVNAGVGAGIRRTGEALQRVPNVSQKISNISASVGSRLPNIIQPNEQAQAQGQDVQQYNNQEQQSSDVQSQLDHMESSIQPLTTNVKGVTGYSVDELNKILVNATKAGDKKAVAMAKDLLEIENSSKKEAKPTGTATERINRNRATIGLRALSDAEKMLKEDPSLLIKGLIPGKPFSRKYEAAAVRTAEQILRMQTGATVTKEEARKYAQEFMPWFGDDPETIQYKLEQMRLDYEQFL